MTTISKPWALLCITLTICGGAVVNGQSAISMSTDASGKTRTFLGGEISVSGDIPAIESKSFTCTLIQPLKKGDTVAAMTSEDQAWSIKKLPLLIGTNNVKYPIWGLVKCSDGNFKSIFPVVLKVNVDIKAGDVIHSDGYEIEVKRSVKAGDSISAVRVGPTSVLSAEADEGAKKSSEAKPWFTAFKEDTTANDRSTTIEAWRIEKDHVGQ